MEDIKSFCPKCGSEIHIECSGIEGDRKVSYKCNSCGAGEEFFEWLRMSGKEFSIHDVINSIMERGLKAAQIKAEKDRARLEQAAIETQHRLKRLQTIANGRCPECNGKIEILGYGASYIPAWRCLSCDRCEKLPEELEPHAEEIARNIKFDKQRQDQYELSLIDLLKIWGPEVGAIGWIAWYTVINWQVPIWSFFLLFVFSRLTDFITTKIGLAGGAIETNPASEARRLTGFWGNFLFWGIVFAVITSLAQNYGHGSFRSIKAGYLIGFGILFMYVYAVMSLAAATHNIFVASFKISGSSVSRIIASIIGLVVACVVLLIFACLLAMAGGSENAKLVFP